MGKNIKRVLAVMERLGEELGRPPSRVELAARLEDLPGSRLTGALQALVEGGIVEEVGTGYFVQVKTEDGREVRWRRMIEG